MNKQQAKEFKEHLEFNYDLKMTQKQFNNDLEQFGLLED